MSHKPSRATELDTLGQSSGVRKIQTLLGKKENAVKVKKGESAIGKRMQMHSRCP